jgi:hypothetical protein|tara:strand:+ start:181 stop:1056 length:876 start_codon:yes stop_codon:yes gene_type:complete
MPNYCFNTLTISGNQKNLNDFLTKNENIEEGQELDFSKSVPVPTDCYMGDLGPDERKQYGSNNWYDVQTKIWGTKWNCSDVNMTRDKDTLTYTFSTAWSPPKSWLITTAEIFDELIFELQYEEAGCDYYGTLSIEYGDITENITGEISEVMLMIFYQIDKDVIRIIEDYFSSKNDILKVLSKKTSSCDDINNLICNFTPTLENIKLYKNLLVNYYPSEDHVLYHVIKEIQEYFENLQDQTLSEHPSIEFDNIMEEYIEDNFTKLYVKYFNNEKKLVHFVDFETGYFKYWGN